MSDVEKIPSINKTAFSCPHCGAYTTQYWYEAYLKAVSGSSKTPYIPTLKNRSSLENDPDISPDEKISVMKWLDRILSGKPFEDVGSEIYGKKSVANLHISKCFNCTELTVWIHDKYIYPTNKLEIVSNPDLPEAVKKLFEEAREIAVSSPKGAAALLRLSIQYLCTELGEKGKNIDDDIASLVRKGLSPMVQQALDVVRVIGNSSVHPGEINLDDDRETAYQLFNLINLIVDQMITHPKNVSAMYNALPQSKLKSIEVRDGK